jgi:O-methyltransferase
MKGPTLVLLDEVAQYALSSRDTIDASYWMARSILARGIEGDFVECGVFAGANAAAMARAILDWNEQWRKATGEPRDMPRKLHLFDSFTGIPQAGPEDKEFLEAGHKPGLSACSLEQVKANMRNWGIPDELLVWHPGMFEDTIPVAANQAKWLEDSQASMPAIRQIALLRLDGDLYESTKVCMEHLYPLVSKGGWVICDDYQLSGARKAVHEVVMPGPVYWVKE